MFVGQLHAQSLVNNDDFRQTPEADTQYDDTYMGEARERVWNGWLYVGV